METLFNKDLLVFNTDVLVDTLYETSLESSFIEDDIVSALGNMQQEQMEFLDIGYIYATEIYRNSSPDISLPFKKVTISNMPTLISDETTIEAAGSNNIIGLVTSSIAIPSFSNYYWQAGDFVSIQNDSFSDSVVSADVDMMATTEMVDSYFLKNTPGQVIVNSVIPSIPDNIKSDDYPTELAVCYGDMTKYYLTYAEEMSALSYSFSCTHSVISKTLMHSANIEFTSSLNIISLKAGAGCVTKKIFTEEYLSHGGYASDNSELKDYSSSNCIPLVGAIETLSSTKAPKTGWIVEDLSKSDTVSNTYLDSLSDSMLSGNKIPLQEENKSIITKGELNTLLGIIHNKLVSIEVCNDS